MTSDAVTSEPFGNNLVKVKPSTGPDKLARSFHERFELDIVAALGEQLESSLGRLLPVALSEGHLDKIQPEQGVYVLYKDNVLVYVGKASNLRARLDEHRRKILGRRRIEISQVLFCAMYVHPNWTALAPETSLIRHYQRKGLCEWNGNGFGPHDPGRNRELTDKDPEGFDSQFPIREDIPVPEVAAGSYTALDLLVRLKENLPFLLRYEVEALGDKRGHFKKGHAAYRDVLIEVPCDAMPASELLKLIADAIDWQATVFPSHMILYNEQRTYAHGRIL